MPKALSTCVYAPDPDAAPDHRGDRPCICRLPKRHPRHQLPDVPAQAIHDPANLPQTTAEQRAAEARRYAEHED